MVGRWKGRTASKIVRQGPEEVALEGGRAERPGPGVEQLEHRRPALRLEPQVVDRHVRQAAEEQVKGARVPVDEPLGLHVLPGRPSLNEVSREGERSAREPDDRALQFLLQEPLDRSADERDRGARVEVGQRLHVRTRADRVPDDGTEARVDRELDPEPRERQRDVREHDPGVDIVPPDRLEGDLRRQLWSARDLEDRVRFPELPVAGQMAPGLPHDPDRASCPSVPRAGRAQGARVSSSTSPGPREARAEGRPRPGEVAPAAWRPRRTSFRERRGAGRRRRRGRRGRIGRSGSGRSLARVG